MENLQMVHQNCVYTCATPIQEAIALGFEHELKRLDSPDCYFNSISKELVSKRDKMVQFLSDIGMVATVPQGGYFMLANWHALADKLDLSGEQDQWKDYKFTKWMTKNIVSKLEMSIQPGTANLSGFSCRNYRASHRLPFTVRSTNS